VGKGEEGGGRGRGGGGGVGGFGAEGRASIAFSWFFRALFRLAEHPPFSVGEGMLRVVDGRNQSTSSSLSQTWSHLTMMR
jgi:hypothetical protein